MNMRLTWSALCIALSLTACEQAEEPAAETTEETEEVAEPEAEEAEEVAEAEEAPAEAAEPTADTLPIPEDFAEQAANEVTPDNYEEQLAAMEKELAE